MTNKRMYYLMLGLVVLLVAGIFGSAYGLNSLLVKQSNQLVSLRAKQAALSQEQVALTKVKKDLATYSGLVQIAKSVVPQDKNQAETVRQIVKIAAANGITLGSIQFPSSTLGGTTTPAGTTGTISPAVKTPGTTTNPSLSQLQPVPNIPGVYNLQIITQNNNDVTYTKLISFLHALEQNRRTAAVSNIVLSPSATQNGTLQFIITLNAYIKP